MPVPQPLPISDVVDVSILISPLAPPTPTFNQALIVGTSTVIPASTRVMQFTSLAQMVTAGFSLTSPEYIGASIYFSQSPAPQYIWIGRQDLTSLNGAATIDTGSGYVVGDIITVVQAGASGGMLKVLAVSGSGVPTNLGQITAGVPTGTGYMTGSGYLATTGGSGTGLEVAAASLVESNLGDSPLYALQQCRLATPQWWACAVLTAVDTDHIAIGEWAQGQTPQLCYFYTTGTAEALNGTTGDPFTELKAMSISRAFGIYSTTQDSVYPNNIYSQCAAMGVAMGLNTGLAGSYFTIALKQLVGITVEPITQSQYSSFLGRNANVYVTFGNAYNCLMNGTVASGQFFDQILNYDMIASDVQYAVMDYITESPAVNQTNAGQTSLLSIVSQAIATGAVVRGFIAGGTWEGVTIQFANTPNPSLIAGQALPSGYTCISDKYSNQSPSDRDARKSLPVYIPIIEAGAVQSVMIGIYVQQ